MRGRIIEVKGKKLYTEHNYSFENRPTIVFLHDSLGSVQLWRDFPAELSDATNCNVLVYDRLGYENLILCPPTKDRLIIWNWKQIF
ncbi:alpha/beta fold hydrolase [Chryseobacterium gallinarum]|uniref:alpha/beta fold hydrolase n=1 Tax=Chryseobacterium gallinarum TaxID=1324352 RepID=UPI001E3A301F|nr:hypothetical protein [Chryseobacterium gallinarum]